MTANSPIAGLPSRKLALEILIKVDKHASYSNLAINAAFQRKKLSERDRAFVTALVQGVMRNRMHLDDEISKFSKLPLKKLTHAVLNILRLAVFQLQEMSDIPASAVLNVSNELAKATGHKGSVSFVNGVLRNYLRKHNSDPDASEVESQSSGAVMDSQNDEGQSLATENGAKSRHIDYSVPQWMAQRWQKNFGASEAEKLMEYATSTPKVVVRVCETAITTDGLQTIFEAKGIKCTRGKLVDSCLIIDKMKGSAEKLPGFADGLFCVQDESSAFASLVMAPQKGDQIIDLCAAPGGKAVHLSELLENTGRVIAVDRSSSRLNLLKKNRVRLGLKNLELAVADGREFVSNVSADRILIDAPCTGTGVINRRADLRYRKDESDIEQLVQLQRELLANAAKLLKPGGVLVYSTCSIEPEENFDNIRWFLSEFADFEGEDFSSLLPAEICAEFEPTGGPLCKTTAEMNRVCMIQLLPTRHGVSGFFVAKLRKRA
jgi:16S rRNA (cytosine967-C5)-methyltransferase